MSIFQNIIEIKKETKFYPIMFFSFTNTIKLILLKQYNKLIIKF